MRKILILAMVFLAAWQWSKLRQPAAPVPEQRSEFFTPEPKQSFQCDGRVYCSQMTSCAEATYFLQNCPGVKMDGNRDGVPCERQWCGAR